tara:strand:- start:42 stop:626 length:585 start_codon:yes stop_codon:yes gene_type:complete
MRLKDTKEILNKFAKYVIQQARTNLTKDKKAKGDKKLYNSLYKKINVYKDSIDVIFGGEDYLPFVDLGVKGNDPSRLSPNAKIKGQQAPNSPYRFGTGSRKGTFKEFTKRMSAFAKAKNIRFRQGKTGKFAKGGYDAMGYVIASNIYNRGIKPSFFFTKPFQRAFKYLPDELRDAFVFDIEQDEKFFPENMNKN